MPGDMAVKVGAAASPLPTKVVVLQQGNPLGVSCIRSFCVRCRKCGGVSWNISFQMFVGSLVMFKLLQLKE